MRPEAHAALVLALLVLALGSGAAASEPGDCDEATSLLLSPDLRSDQARAGEAADLLSAERTRKLADLSSDFVDLGIHASLQASPFKLLRSAGRIGRGVRDWNDRTHVEDQALALLESGARSGDLDAESLALYARLERRESEARVAQLLADAERSFGAGDLRRTHRTIDRALALEPGSSRADRLLDEIEEREWRTSLDREIDVAKRQADDTIDAWEVQLGAALLLDDFDRARELGPPDATDAALARATAAYLEGDRTLALDEFHRIARGDDSAAICAGEFLADSDVDPAGALDDQVRLYRARRALGWMGGSELAETAVPSAHDALSLSRDGLDAWRVSYRAWSGALSPVNLVIDAPVRAWRSWQPDGADLRGAAARYLEISPDGERAADAVDWLDTLGAQERQSPRVSAFQDGILVLPHSRTPWSRLSTTQIVVARAALEATAPELLSGLADDVPAVLLALDTEKGRVAESGTKLPAAVSLALLARLATGLEGATLSARGDRASGVLVSLRRMDSRVRAGRTLVASAWLPGVASGADALQAALLDGARSRTAGHIEVERRDERFVAERSLDDANTYCPRETRCIDLRPELDPMFFANSDSSGELGVGARASFDEARLSLEVGTYGPRASLVIPVARWLGITRYFPVEARLAVGLDGISAEPRLVRESAELPDPSF